MCLLRPQYAIRPPSPNPFPQFWGKGSPRAAFTPLPPELGEGVGGWGPNITPGEAPATVIVITRDQREFLRRSLPRLKSQMGLAAPVEIIVVDSGSTDGTRNEVEQAGAVWLPFPSDTRFCYARAYNVGFRRATAPFVVRLSGDAIPADEDWLKHLLLPLQRDTRVAATWGRQAIPDYVRNPIERRAEQWLRPERQQTPRQYQRDITVLGSSMAIRRDLWEVWPFDERLPQAEDYAWMHHWYRRGFTGVYAPGAVIAHGHDEPLMRAVRRAFAQSALQGLVLSGWTEWRPGLCLSS